MEHREALCQVPYDHAKSQLLARVKSYPVLAVVSGLAASPNFVKVTHIFLHLIPKAAMLL